MRLPAVLGCAWEELGLGAVFTLSGLLGLHPCSFLFVEMSQQELQNYNCWGKVAWFTVSLKEQ